jgi:hypothetical protein
LCSRWLLPNSPDVGSTRRTDAIDVDFARRVAREVAIVGKMCELVSLILVGK